MKFSSNVGSAPWKDDKNSHRCEGCWTNFTFFLRRHHCRACGELFCGQCTRQTDVYVPGYEGKKARVCDACKKDPPAAKKRLALEIERAEREAAEEKMRWERREAEEAVLREQRAMAERARVVEEAFQREARRAMEEVRRREVREAEDRAQAALEEEERRRQGDNRDEWTRINDWKRAVEAALKFRTEGPADGADNATWRAKKESLPSYGALVGGCDGMKGRVYKLGQKKLFGIGGDWSERYTLIHGRFLYYFKKAAASERPQGAVYLYGCTTEAVEGTFMGRDNVLRLTPSVPRRSESDIDATSHIFYLSLELIEDVAVWRGWVEAVALPPAPRFVKQDLIAEVLIRGNGAADVGTHWKSDDDHLSCEGCELPFSVFLRRHHCRICGGIFCDACCGKNSKGHRKCQRCVLHSNERDAT